jgi:hypothetical protein
MTRRAGHFARLVALALGLAAAGCSNPFLPAQAPSPTAGGGSSFTPDYNSAEGVLSTVASAIGARNTVGEIAYLNAFADSLDYGFNAAFTLDDSVRALAERSGQPAPAVWRLEYETAFYRYLGGVSDASGEYDMSFFDLPDMPKEEFGNPVDRVVFHREYVVTAGPADSPVPVAKGAADIDVRHVTSPANRWVIVSWSDHLFPGISATTSDPGDFCFSRLRIDSYYHTETTP